MMKFKKEITFDDIYKAREYYCRNGSDCDKCALYNKLPEYNNCIKFCEKQTEIAAEIMGYDVIEDEDTIDKQDESQDISKWTAEQIQTYCLNHYNKDVDAYSDTYICNSDCVIRKHNICINNPYNWKLNTKKLTQQEIDICKGLGAKYVCRGEFATIYVELFENKPDKNKIGQFMGHVIATVDADKMPNVKPGDCICVEYLV